MQLTALRAQASPTNEGNRGAASGEGGGAQPSCDGSIKAGPGLKTSRHSKAAWLPANIAHTDPSVRSQRGLRRAADPSAEILNRFSNRKSKLGSSDTDSQLGSSRRNRDPTFGSPKWDMGYCRWHSRSGSTNGNPKPGVPLESGWRKCNDKCVQLPTNYKWSHAGLNRGPSGY